MDPLSGAIVKQFPDKFGGLAAAAPAPAPAAGNATTARDGKSLSGESAATQASFRAVWGDRAATEWATEHTAMIGSR
jgi:hypothetical protein